MFLGTSKEYLGRTEDEVWKMTPRTFWGMLDGRRIILAMANNSGEGGKTTQAPEKPKTVPIDQVKGWA